MDFLLFSWIDYFLLAILLVSLIAGLIRGFAKEVLSLITWILATLVSIAYSATLATLLAPYLHTPLIARIASFFSLFVACIIVGALFNMLIGSMIRRVGLSGLDRSLGLVFGLARGGLLVVVLLWAGHLTTIIQQTAWQKAVLIPYLLPLVDYVNQLITAP